MTRMDIISIKVRKECPDCQDGKWYLPHSNFWKYCDTCHGNKEVEVEITEEEEINKIIQELKNETC